MQNPKRQRLILCAVLILISLFQPIYASVIEYTSDCLPGGITFTTQAEIDNFSVNYPGCDQILGFVEIQESVSGGITDLSGLIQLKQIDGYFKIGNNVALSSLSGLDSLRNVGGYLSILYTVLNNLNGLEKLESIGGYFQIGHNFNMTHINALSNLSSIGSYLQINNNFSLVNLVGLESLSTIPSFCNISNHTNLISLNGLDNISSIGGYFYLFSNVALTDVSALSILNTISGYMHIEVNLALESLSGLENLGSLDGFLRINNNDALTEITALSGITTINNNTLELDGNALLDELRGLHNISHSSINNLIITNNPSLEACEESNICAYLNGAGTATINNNASGCTTIAELNTNCDYDNGWTGNSGTTSWHNSTNWLSGLPSYLDRIKLFWKNYRLRIQAAQEALAKRIKLARGTRITMVPTSRIRLPSRRAVTVAHPDSGIDGTGVIEGNLLIESGRIAPGESAGTLRVEGNFINTDGVVEIEIGGTIPGAEYDQLIVTDTANLAGDLLVTLINSYIPQTLPQSFDVVTYGYHMGSFNVQLPSTPGIDWNAVHFNDRISITATACPDQTVDPQFKVQAGDAYIEEACRGLVLTSPAGYCYRITIDDAGNLQSQVVPCP